MAMTAQEKATRRAARTERNRAWRVRCQEMEAALSVMQTNAQAALAPILAEIVKRREAIAAEQHKALAVLDVAETACRAEQVEVHRRAREAITDALAARFPDLAGDARWSAAAWRRL